MKFLLDMGISPKLLSFLKNKGHDATHTHYIGLSQASDKTILEHAISNNLILVTTDLDFTRLVAIEGITSLSLIIMRLENPSSEAMISHMEKMLNNFSSEDLMEAVIILEPHRIRKRKLPIISNNP